MQKPEEHDEAALHTEVVSLKKRVEALEARVTELEMELRESQEVAPVD